MNDVHDECEFNGEREGLEMRKATRMPMLNTKIGKLMDMVANKMIVVDGTMRMKRIHLYEVDNLLIFMTNMLLLVMKNKYSQKLLSPLLLDCRKLSVALM